MITRNELKQLTLEINSFIDTPPLPDLKKITEQIDLVLPLFETEERSLKGKTVILGNLSESLQRVAGKISAALPWYIRIANFLHCWETEEQIDILENALELLQRLLLSKSFEWIV